MSEKKEPKIDWNIWHDAFMDAYDQINFETCAKAILFYKSLAFAEDCSADPNDREQVEEETFKLRDTVINEIKCAILGWMKFSKEKKATSPYTLSTGFVRVDVWGPEADEDEHKATIEVTVFLHESIL